MKQLKLDACVLPLKFTRELLAVEKRSLIYGGRETFFDLERQGRWTLWVGSCP